MKENYTSSRNIEKTHVIVSRDWELNGNVLKSENYISPMRFPRSQCSEAINMTRIIHHEEDGDDDDTDRYEEIDSPCLGGNLQCYGKEEDGSSSCGMSSCRLSDPNCFPCDAEGCQECQNASQNNKSVCSQFSPKVEGGHLDYCNCIIDVGCGGKSGQDKIDCLDEKKEEIINCCDSSDPQNMCALNVEKDKTTNMCDLRHTETDPEQTDNTGKNTILMLVLAGLFVGGTVLFAVKYKPNTKPLELN